MHTSSRWRAVILTALGLAGPLAMPATALTDAQKCQASKLKEAGKYGFCRLKAEVRAVKSAAAADYATCDLKFATKWNAAEAAAAGACTTNGDQDGARDFIAEHTDTVAAVLAGDLPPPDCGDDLAQCTGDLDQCGGDLAALAAASATCAADLSACSGSLATLSGKYAICTMDLAGSQAAASACNDGLSSCMVARSGCEISLAIYMAGLDQCEARPIGQRLQTGQVHCTGPSGLPVGCLLTGQDGEWRYGLAIDQADNGDGTISDRRTGLMWEKLGNDGGIHDRDDSAAWADAFAKVATLNATGFAGHSDWRLPNVNELQSLVNYGAAALTVFPAFDGSCVPGCAVTDCSCTPAVGHWTSTSRQGAGASAWTIDFASGAVAPANKLATLLAVRAVRGG
ncbi:MAG: DUF1566 domain-containing protein [Candidatus Binatia bacterium]